MKIFNDILCDGLGRIVGTVEARRRPLTKRERDVCSQFVETVSRGRREFETVSENMKANVVALAGEVKKLTVDGKRGFLLLDCGPEPNKAKWVPCTVFDDAVLLEKLDRFAAGDYIKVKGYVRVWSEKNEKSGEWKTNVEARIEEIPMEPPRRAAKTASNKTAFDNDGLPF